MTGRLKGLPPLVNERTVLLILGSFPGVASLAAQQYYGHPLNHFWPIIEAILGSSPHGYCASSYQNRIDWMLSRGVGLWDVYASCERAGSLDTRIRNAEVNDFVGLGQRCPELRVIAHNGGESFKHASHVTAALGMDDMTNVGVQFFRLPSSSRANASWGFARKLEAWREVFAEAGLA